MKSRAAIISALLVTSVTAFSGCSNGNETTSDNSQSASEYTSSTTMLSDILYHDEDSI